MYVYRWVLLVTHHFMLGLIRRDDVIHRVWFDRHSGMSAATCEQSE